MLNSTVRMTKHLATWTIKHPEIYLDTETSAYEANMQMAMVVLLGGEVKGLVINQGFDSKTFGVYFDCGIAHDFLYCEYPRDIQVVK